MDQALLSFCSILVKPDEQVIVSTQEDSIWTMTSVAIDYNDNLPKQGRVVLYVAKYDDNGEVGQKIAIAPLRICECEVVNIELSTFGPLVFTTEGSDIPVSISGYTDTPYPLVIDRKPKK